MSSEPIRAIDDIKLLEADWDSYEAPRVSDAACDAAKRLVTSIENTIGQRYASPLVSPTPEGGIALIWRPGRRWKVQVFVGSTGVARFSVVENGRVISRGEVDDPASFATTVIQKYVAV